jgi:hypothetical protein
VIPFQAAFRHQVLGLSSAFIYLIDLLFLVDIFFNFRTSFRQRGQEVTDLKRITGHYLKTLFAFDLAASLPLDALILILGDFQVANISFVLLLRLLRLIRVIRLYVILRRWELQNWMNPGYFRIVKFLGTMMLLIHWVACAWFMVAWIAQFPADSWVVREGVSETDISTQYIRSLYWTVQTMTTVGYGDVALSRAAEYSIAIFVMLLGASMYAFIIGTLASLFSNLDSTKAAYWNRIEALMQYLRYRHVPYELNSRIRDYYDYVWAIHRGLHEDTFLGDLPKPLRLEALLHLTRKLLDNVPLFKFCSPVLRDVLLTSLRARTYAPNGTIVREGEIGREIYFISHGKVEVVSGDGQKVHATLEGGDYFGDLSLLLGETRTASVRTLSYCEIFLLSGEDFKRIKEEYAEFKDVLKKASAEKTEKTSALVLDGIVL